MILANKDEIARLKDVFTKEYTWITLDVGAKHSYLGIQIKIQEGSVTVDMIHYIETMLALLQNIKEFSTPQQVRIYLLWMKQRRC